MHLQTNPCLGIIGGVGFGLTAPAIMDELSIIRWEEGMAKHPGIHQRESLQNPIFHSSLKNSGVPNKLIPVYLKKNLQFRIIFGWFILPLFSAWGLPYGAPGGSLCVGGKRCPYLTGVGWQVGMNPRQTDNECLSGA